MDKKALRSTSFNHIKKLTPQLSSPRLIPSKSFEELKKSTTAKYSNQNQYFVSNKLREETKDSEKKGVNKNAIITSGESLEKATNSCNEIPVSLKTSCTSIVLTSPDGKVKDLLNNNLQKSRPKILFGIPCDSNFWLPKIKTPSYHNDSQIESKPCAEIAESDKEDDCNIGNKTETTEELRKFQEVLRSGGLKLERKLSKELLHICETIDKNWVAVSQESVLCYNATNGSMSRVLIKEINSIKVDLDYLSLCLVPNLSSDFLEIIPGESSKTESLITSLLFAASRLENHLGMDGRIVLTAVPILEMPSMKAIVKNICENDGEAKENILFSGIVLVESVQPEAQITDEFMMQTDVAEKFKPVDIKFSGTCLKIIPSYKEMEIEGPLIINVKDISNFTKKETPRPYTLNLSWNHTSINLCASNSAIINEVLERLRVLKEANKVISQQTAHILVNEYFLFLIAVSRTKELLLTTPLLNIIVLDQDDQLSCFIGNHSKEADESVCSSTRNTSWVKITFSNEFQRGNFKHSIKSSLNSY